MVKVKCTVCGKVVPVIQPMTAHPYMKSHRRKVENPRKIMTVPCEGSLTAAYEQRSVSSAVKGAVERFHERLAELNATKN